eukprot:CAMPEP_0198729724 /NCGR_PEP_ID=MMETSP1475-20131203/20711_1 /TAXON_ID= ORGANISM="Unidentified sp., Strain CCMP1999" /NCGR_SAMPLE_ID=MMETSP1475 /ASSEMBLY_ACC=CAM_ASM_001111 /LENGTH=204 /DNA_ID=CAMNT_0044492425 /DNA_START=342 /DNA_END=953 /DNA_ORIENTATION=-
MAVDSSSPATNSSADIEVTMRRIEHAVSGPLPKLCELCADGELQFAKARKRFPFYALYMLALIAELRLLDARFLWRRCDPEIKENGMEISAAFEIVKLAFKKEWGPAASLAERSSWCSTTSPLAARIADLMRRRALEVVARSYSCISVSTCSQLLGLSESDTVDYVNQAAEGSDPWRKEDSFLLPSPLTPEPLGSKYGDGVQQL